MAAAQTFDAASIKPAVMQMGRYGMHGGPGTSDPGRITYFNVSLKDLLSKAFDVERYQVEGPASLDSARYDVVASVPHGATKDDLLRMLQNLLAERFGLVEHRETKELPIYAMVVGKNGPKMKVSPPKTAEDPLDDPVIDTITEGKDGFPVMPRGFKGHMIGMKRPGKTALRAKEETLDDFAKVLSDMVDRPVFDYTNLTEKYDFGISWSDDFDVSSALQYHLGLKLEPRRGQVNMLVVDRVEKAPSSN
jgi:uncharacterized protein (TIGR03435 family)